MCSLSIITVTYNDLENLKRTYASILIQSDKDFQWIIKDGFSTDGTKKFYENNINGSVTNCKFISVADKSRYDAMNQAKEFISCNYVLYLNAGDCLASENTISDIKNELKGKEPVSFVYGDAINILSDGNQIYARSRPLSYLSNSLPTSHQAILYNSTLVKKYSYPLDYRIASDYAFTAIMFYDGNTSFIRLPFPVCMFFLGGESTTRRDLLLKEGYMIHRKIVGNGPFLAALKLYKRKVTLYLLDNMPHLYRLLR